MLRSMFAAVSGLRTHQMMMDVTGNNVANVNTTGYKATRATFREALTQSIQGGTASVAFTQGGANPMQIGLGTAMSATDSVFSQGATQVTGRATDLAIQGEGFFMVANGDPSSPDTQQMFTRAGAFGFDAAGNLVTASGGLVMGFMDGDLDDGVEFDPATADPTAVGSIQIDFERFSDLSIGRDGVIRAREGDQEVAIGMIAVARFPNPGGLEREGSGMFTAGVNAGAPQVGQPGAEGRGAVEGGTLEMSNVDLALEFTNLITAQRGFQANARTITSTDEMLQDLVNLKR